MDGKYYIYPVQYPLYGEAPKEFVPPQEKIYSSSENYPGKLVEFHYEGYFKDFHIVEIKVYPFQYKPAGRVLVLNTEINVAIEYKSSGKYQLLPRLRQDLKKQNDLKEKLKHLIINPEDVTLSTDQSNTILTQKVKTKSLSIASYPSATEGQNVEYIIITNDELALSFQRLADWKTKKRNCLHY